MMKSTGAAAALFAVTLSAGFAGSALAQNAAQPRSNDASAPPPAAASQAADERPAVRAPVLKVLSVEVIRSTHGTPLDIVRVRGLTSSQGWEEAELVPLTRGTPKDGMLELMFVA